MSRLLKICFTLLFVSANTLANEKHIALVLDKLEADVRSGNRTTNLPVLLTGIEDDLLEVPAPLQASAIGRLLRLTVGILKRRNLNVPADDSVGRWPDFNWKQYGAKPLFAGASPDSIQDKVLRDAYVRALEAHDKLRSKIAAEKGILEDADCLLSLERRVIQSAASKEGIARVALNYLSNPDVPDWIGAYIKERLFGQPPHDGKGRPAPKSTDAPARLIVPRN